MIIADTHAWLWWTSFPAMLSRTATRVLNDAPIVGISPISCWEIATLIHRRRIDVDGGAEQWLEFALRIEKVRLIPIDIAIAIRAARLPPEFPGDPGDRLIAATAIEHRVPLVTKDERIRRAAVVDVRW